MTTKSTKALRGAAVVLAMGFGGAVALPASQAHATFICETVAVNAFGNRIRGTARSAQRVSERRACRVALRACRRALNNVRYRTGRQRPFANCVVANSYLVGGHGGGGYGYGYNHGGGYCNFRACDARYRSFRPSDCSFQPYNGPRRRCTL